MEEAGRKTVIPAVLSTLVSLFCLRKVDFNHDFVYSNGVSYSLDVVIRISAKAGTEMR